jgi:hypothetical protein
MKYASLLGFQRKTFKEKVCKAFIRRVDPARASNPNCSRQIEPLLGMQWLDLH